MKHFSVLLILFMLTCALAFGFRKEYSLVTVEFQKLRPITGRINVYYNGFKTGYVKSIYPCKTSNKVCVSLLLDTKNIFLPENITAKMKQKRINERKFEDYVELIYPNIPSYKSVGSNTVLQGELAADFHNYLYEEVDYGEMERIKLSLLNSAENLEKSTSVLLEILYSLDDILKSSKNDAKSGVKYLTSSLGELNSLTNKINSSIDEDFLRSAVTYSDSAIKNLNSLSYDLSSFAYGLNNNSDTIFDSVCKLDSILNSADEILNGFNCTLKRPFGGLRILFGKTIK